MADDPVLIARRIRARRRIVVRIVRISLPITLLGMAVLFVLGRRVSEPRMNLVVVPTVLAFFITWLSMLALWILGSQDLRNKFRPGSARAYEDED